MKKQVEITAEKVAKAMRILSDNGVDVDECDTVVQAIGYALLDTELQPLIDEVSSKDLF